MQDSICPNCSSTMYSSQPKCFVCGSTVGEKREAAAAPKLVLPRNKVPSSTGGDWTCPKCSSVVFAKKCSCFKCGCAKPPASKPGLALKLVTGRRDEAPDAFSDQHWEQPREQTGLSTVLEDAAHLPWQYALKDESRRSFAAFLKCPFTSKQTRSLFQTIRDATEWLQPIGPNGPIPRKTAWMVSGGCRCVYRYGRIEVPPTPYPQWMVDLMWEVMPRCGINDFASMPNACNLNLYEDGGHGVGWHTDDESLFNGKFQDMRIISLSLGAARKFEMRLNWPDCGEKKFRSVVLADGDLATMEGMFQKHLQHRVPREENVHGARINLTWRWNVRHQACCPACRRRR